MEEPPHLYHLEYAFIACFFSVNSPVPGLALFSFFCYKYLFCCLGTRPPALRQSVPVINVVSLIAALDAWATEACFVL